MKNRPIPSWMTIEDIREILFDFNNQSKSKLSSVKFLMDLSEKKDNRWGLKEAKDFVEQFNNDSPSTDDELLGMIINLPFYVAIRYPDMTIEKANELCSSLSDLKKKIETRVISKKFGI
jgi:hypothetical protein